MRVMDVVLECSGREVEIGWWEIEMKGVLAVGTVAGPVAILFPPEYQPKVAVPVGLALAWLGYALWSERVHAGQIRARPVMAG